MQLTHLPPLTAAQPIDSAAVQSLCTALAHRYPHVLRHKVIGHSLCGRPIHALTVSPPDAINERVLVAAAFHAQEWLTALVALRLTEDIARGIHARLTLCGIPLRQALRGRQVTVVPLVNPDGVDIARHGSAAAGEYAPLAASLGADAPALWQANARGVDLNHNYNAGWDIPHPAMPTGPAPRRWRGTMPESEPETRAVTDLCRRHRYRHLVALHSQGEEIYWQYGDNTPPESALIAEVLAAASGYALAEPTGAAAHGGCKDWFIRCYHRPAFTIELGRGQNPLPLSDYEPLYKKAQEMLLLATMV